MTWLHTDDVYPAWDIEEAHMEAFGRIRVAWNRRPFRDRAKTFFNGIRYFNFLLIRVAFTHAPYVYRPKYPLYSQITWVGDDLDFEFEDPKDWPELDAATVEDYNAVHRAAFNHRVAVMKEFTDEFPLMYEKHRLAFTMMEVVKQVRFNKLFGYHRTDFIVGYVHNDNWMEDFVDDAERLLIERHKAKKDKDWKRADEIRNQLKSWGYEIRDEKEGAWFIFKAY